MTASSSPAPKPVPRGTPGSSDTKPAAPAGRPTGQAGDAAKPSLEKAPAKASAPKHAATRIASTPSTPPGKPASPAAAKPATPPRASEAAPVRTAASGAEPSIGQLVSDASNHLSNLIHSEIELAKLELRSTVKNAGVGAGLFAAAAVVLVFSLTFAFFALAEGIAALGLDRWLAFLIVFGMQLAAAGLFVYVGIKKVKRVRAPERTIRTTKETVDYLKKSRGS